ERLCQLHPDEHRPLRGQPLLAVDQGPQIQAVDPLHGQVQPAILLAGIKYRDHVRMINGSGKPRLPQETLAVVARLADLPDNSLNDHRSAKNPAPQPGKKAPPPQTPPAGGEGPRRRSGQRPAPHPQAPPFTCPSGPAGGRARTPRLPRDHVSSRAPYVISIR